MTRILQHDPLVIERGPKDASLHWTRAHWSQATWMSRVNWPLTLDSWVLQDAPWDPHTGLPTLPDTWATVPLSHGYSTIEFAFASPFGHLFACRTTGTTVRVFLLPHPSPAPTHDDTANILKAGLGHAFFCYRCMRRHRPDSAALRTCQLSTPTRLEEPAGTPRVESFHDSTRALEDRVRWYRQKGQLTPEQDTAWTDFSAWVASQALDMTVPVILHTELASVGGLHAYHLRLQTWHDQIQDEYVRRTDALALRREALERLLTPPHPVGPPCCTRLLTPPIFDGLTEGTRRELARVQEALPHLSSTLSYDSSHLTLRFVRPRRSSDPGTPTGESVNLWHILREAFGIFISSVICRSRSSERWLTSVDAIGLDPRFWNMVRFTKSELVFSTQTVTLLPLPPPSRLSPDPVSQPTSGTPRPRDLVSAL